MPIGRLIVDPTSRRVTNSTTRMDYVALLRPASLYFCALLGYIPGMAPPSPSIPKPRIPREVRKLGKIFAEAGYETRIVGGWVRDTLRGIDPKDLDLATTATPDQMVEVCTARNLRYFETGIKHGTLTVLPTVKTKAANPQALADDWKRGKMTPDVVPAFEITTLRIDRETDGRHAEVEFTTDWRQDAARRDFTINAMSVGMDGTLYDYFGGQQHLADHRVIFVGDAAARIQEDYLRILRFFRFRSRMGDQTYDREILTMIERHAPDLTRISVERVWMEMSKILAGNPAMLCLCLIDMLKTGVLAQIGLDDVERYDIVHATIVRDQTANPLTVLTALTKSPIADVWKMSTPEKRLLEFLQPLRRIPRPELAFFKEIAFNHGYEYAVEAASLFGPSETLQATRDWTPVNLPIRGEDLIAMGMRPGPGMGEILKQLTRVWIDSDYRMDKSALLALV